MLIFSRIVIQLPFNTMGVYVFNISSFSECGVRLDALTPPRMDISDPNAFILAYRDYVFNNHDAFMQLMDIVYKLYQGSDVILMVGPDDPFRTLLTEAISKVIQCRYGYISSFVNDLEDMNGLVEGEFTVEGLHYLDIDKETYMKAVIDDASIGSV